MTWLQRWWPNCYTMCGLYAGSKLCKTPVNSNDHTIILQGQGRLYLVFLSAATTLSCLGRLGTQSSSWCTHLNLPVQCRDATDTARWSSTTHDLLPPFLRLPTFPAGRAVKKNHDSVAHLQTWRNRRAYRFVHGHFQFIRTTFTTFSSKPLSRFRNTVFHWDWFCSNTILTIMPHEKMLSGVREI